jgi:hypothetical protein
LRRLLLIALALVLALVGSSTVSADDGFYVIPVMRAKYAPVPKTGQTQSYAAGDDGNLQKGVAWPTPRFTDNKNGTVTDNLTGLIWMQNANAFGPRTWAQAISDANGLKSDDAGLSDGSKAGDWRLPNIRELQSLVDYGHGGGPEGIALPTGHPFIGVEWQSPYWSSTSENAGSPNLAWFVGFDLGVVDTQDKANNFLVWCVRGGP